VFELGRLENPKIRFNGIDTIEKVRKIFDGNILTKGTYGTYIELLTEQCKDLAKICLDGGDIVCPGDSDGISVPIENKEKFVLFAIKFIYFLKYYQENIRFIKGFHSVIKSDTFSMLDMKQLNKLIVGTKEINVDTILDKIKITEWLPT